MAWSKVVQEQTVWETIKLQGVELLDKLKQIIHEGNARRIIVKQENRIIAEFPLTAGVVGALLAPILAAIGALVALLKDCSIEVERAASDSGPGQSKPNDFKPGV
jgi:Domain of unknown function (DUF4342)